MYWFSYPAMLKGWIERCFMAGFSYDFEEKKLLDQGNLKVKTFLPYFKQKLLVQNETSTCNNLYNMHTIKTLLKYS